jgi:hypothetical protein
MRGEGGRGRDREKERIMMYTYDLTWEAEAGGLRAGGQPG